MNKNVIFSTLTTDVKFVKYADSPGGSLPRPLMSVVIKGGANNPQRKTFITPKGVATVVTDDQMAFLAQNKSFQAMMENGHISIGKDPDDAGRAAAHMNPADAIAPKTESTMKAAMAAQGARGKDGDAGSISSGALEPSA